jgi:peptidoglycan/LPS O-acetylase OafA/YrhL
VQGEQSRLIVLDSFRAIAALYVVAFHYLHRWTLPGDEQLILPIPFLANNPVIAHGFLGVEFFFLISGFVIALTLERTETIFDFATKRFARLFPAMLFCSVLTFVTVLVLGIEPFSDVQVIDFLPSLTFISPQIYNKLLGVNSDWVSGVYWSLFVEVKFYFYAAVIYFFSKKQNFLRNFSLFTGILCLVYWIAVGAGNSMLANLLALVFVPKYGFLFVAGMAFYEVFKSESRKYGKLAALVLAALIYTMVVYLLPNDSVQTSLFAAAMIVVFFALFHLFAMRSGSLNVLSVPWLAQIGAASYSLYLLHDSVGTALIARANQDIAESLWWPLLVAIVVIGLSMWTYRFVEVPARRLIRRILAAI